jgi:hypothetical protein
MQTLMKYYGIKFSGIKILFNLVTHCFLPARVSGVENLHFLKLITSLDQISSRFSSCFYTPQSNLSAMEWRNMVEIFH